MSGFVVGPFSWSQHMSLVTSLTKPTPQKSTGLFDYISPTRLNTWLSCPLKFKIRYEDGVEDPPSPSLFLGKRAHEALAFFYRHLQEGERVTAADVARQIIETWDEAVEDEQLDFGSTGDEIALQRQAIDLVEKYLEQRDSDEGVPLAVEMPLECPLVAPDTGEDLGIALFGIVDLVLDTSLGAVIVDFRLPPARARRWKSLTRSNFRATPMRFATSLVSRSENCRSAA
jgi:hypothetical protein